VGDGESEGYPGEGWVEIWVSDWWTGVRQWGRDVGVAVCCGLGVVAYRLWRDQPTRLPVVAAVILGVLGGLAVYAVLLGAWTAAHAPRKARDNTIKRLELALSHAEAAPTPTPAPLYVPVVTDEQMESVARRVSVTPDVLKQAVTDEINERERLREEQARRAATEAKARRFRNDATKKADQIEKWVDGLRGAIEREPDQPPMPPAILAPEFARNMLLADFVAIAAMFDEQARREIPHLRQGNRPLAEVENWLNRVEPPLRSLVARYREAAAERS
jgi:hypothetical protein